MTINLPKYIGTTALLAGTLAISSSAQAATLYSQANIVTNPGSGFGGADVSAIAPPANTFGFGAAQDLNRRLADDFTVPVGGWLVDSISVLAYVTSTDGSPPSSPFTGISMNIWNGTPGGGGTIIASSSNLQSTNWSGIYRTDGNSANFTNAQRPVMNVVAAFPSLSLGQGTYWVDWTLTDNTTSSSFVPPVMTASGNQLVGNSRQFVTAWNNLIEAGTNQAVDLPFSIDGTAVPESVAVPESHSAPALIVLGGFLLVRRAVKRKLTYRETPISFKD